MLSRNIISNIFFENVKIFGQIWGEMERKKARERERERERGILNNKEIRKKKKSFKLKRSNAFHFC